MESAKTSAERCAGANVSLNLERIALGLAEAFILDTGG